MADNTNMTFEQWLESKQNLTPQLRKALEERKSQANVTFTPESFDRYLEELRAVGKNSSSQGITPEQYKEAIDLSKGDLTQMSYEDIAKVWQVVGGLDDRIAQATKPEALQAKQKMADFAEQLMSKVNPNQPWSMSVAPEVSEWLKINNQTIGNSQTKQVRNEKIEESLNKFYQQFDKEHDLIDLSPEHVAMLAKNQQAIETLAADFEPFAKNDKGEYLHPEFANIDKFYDKMEIDNSNKNVDAVDKDKYKQDMAELAYNEAMLELSMNPDFARLQPAQQQELLSQAWANHMQMGMVTMIAAQMAENAAQKSGEPKKIKDFENQANIFINQALKGENNTFKISNNAALATLSFRTVAVEAVSKRVGQKTGHKSLWKKIKEFDKKLAKKYPKTYPLVRNLAISTSIGLASGGVGLAALSAYKTGKAIKQSYKRYKEANKEGQYKSWFGYLRKNPKEAIGLAVSVASTAMSAYMVGIDGISSVDFGLGGQVYQNGIGNTWEAMKTSVGNVFSSSDTLSNQSWTDRVSEFGKNFGEQVVKTTQDGNRMARLGISLTGGISSGAVDFIASFREKDPEKKKQLRKNARRALAGVFIGSMASLGFSAFVKANNEVHSDTASQEVAPDRNHSSNMPKRDWTKSLWEEDQQHSSAPRTIEEPTKHSAPTKTIEDPTKQSIERETSPDNFKQDEIVAPEKDVDIDMSDPKEDLIQNDNTSLDYAPQTDNEKALFEELRRGHNIGNEDATAATTAAKEDFNHYMQLKNEGNFEEADEFLRGRHDLFEDSEHQASNQVQDTDNRRVSRAKEEASQAYNNYQEALKELRSNPNDSEAQAKFDAAAREISKADVDKTEAVIKQEIKGLRDNLSTDESNLERIRLQQETYKQESGSLESVDKYLVKLGFDPNNLPQDTSSLSPEAQACIKYHNDLTTYQRMESTLSDRISETRQELYGKKEILHDLRSRHEETAGNAVNQYVAGYESYEGSRLQDLNEKIAVERDNSAAIENQTSQETKILPNSEEQKTKQPENRSETRSKLEEAKQRLNKHFESIPPEEKHSLAGGTYYIMGDENSYTVSDENIALASYEQHEFSSQIIWTQQEGKYYANGVEIGNGTIPISELKQDFTRNLATDEKIYYDLTKRASGGETLGKGEQNFMKAHEENLNKFGLTRDSEGRIVQNDELKKITQQYRSSMPTKGEGR